MLSELKFVQGAVAKKDPVAVLTHFHICGGRIKGFNGVVTLSAPIALAIDCQPKATSFTKAIAQCDDIVSLSLTSSGKLTVKSGKFRSHIECSPEPFPEVEPEGEYIELADANLLQAFTTLLPLIGQDASRKWARGILFHEGSAYATNNVVIAQYWTGAPLPTMNIPEDAVKELVRLKEEPHAIQFTETSATFHYSGERWVRTQLLTTEGWPLDGVDRILGRDCAPEPITPGFFDALEAIAPFADPANRRVIFDKDGVRTHVDESGSSVSLDDWAGLAGVYNLDMLRSLSGLVAVVDWSLYPLPALFFGEERFRGAISGMRA